MKPVNFSTHWQKIKDSVSFIVSVFLVGVAADIGVGAGYRTPVSWKLRGDLRVHSIYRLLMKVG